AAAGAGRLRAAASAGVGRLRRGSARPARPAGARPRGLRLAHRRAGPAGRPPLRRPHRLDARGWLPPAGAARRRGGTRGRTCFRLHRGCMNRHWWPALPLHEACGKLATFPPPGFRRVRAAFRLLPLPLCIALSLAAHADDDIPVNWALCPVEDAVPLFPDAQAPVGNVEDRENLPTDIQCDQTLSVDGDIYNVTGNVTLRRCDHFLGTDDIAFSQETGTYTATGYVRYQDSGMRVVAECLEGDQYNDSHRIDNVCYQLTERRGNGGAERIEMDESR